IEAKLGVLVDTRSRERYYLPVETECVLSKYAESFRFESKMTRVCISESLDTHHDVQLISEAKDQHSYFNQLLNRFVGDPKYKGEVRCKHRKEVDKYYRVDGRKVRMTFDKQQDMKYIENTTIEKQRIADLNIYCPRSRLDYRISVNVELPMEGAVPVDERPEFTRDKDRLSYSYQAFAFDLTQVSDSNSADKVHELEIEFLNTASLMQEKLKLDARQPNQFGDLLTVFLNNVRLLARESNNMKQPYDSDITTWSPQGRIHQVEYAMEAVKQGSAAIGLKSQSNVVLVTLNRSASELASFQKKLIRIDDHMGIAIAGLMSDARVLSTFMRTEAMKSRMVYNRSLPVSRIAALLGDKAQVNTQRYGGRPYGVGLLIAGVDETGTHLYEFSPSGNCFDYVAISIGARSQSAKTYLEKYYESFANADLDALILHGLRALRDTLQQDAELSVNSCSIGYVGTDKQFTVIEGEALQAYVPVTRLRNEKLTILFLYNSYLDLLKSDPSAAAAAPANDDAAPMETDS
ncbi:hypothetical protein HDV05_006241, partial [Chytridiales sp. JEL 0842]